MKSDHSVVRIRILSACFVALGLLLIIRLYFVQVIHGDEYEKDAMGQYVAPAPDTENRGSIFFTAKDGTLAAAAVMQRGWRIAVVPKDVADEQSTYAALNAITPIDGQKFYAGAGKKSDPYEEIAFRVSDAAAQKIRAKKLPGVILVQDEWRFYPAHELAAQTIGFVGYQGDVKVGVYGLEREWQRTLVQPSAGLYVNPFAELFTNMEALLSTDPASHQGDIVTSIEPSVERQLETILESVMQTYAPRIAGGIVMNPRTGEIVAMAVKPSFDLNTYNLITEPGVFSNPLIEGRYEMGSIMKPLTLAAGIDAGAVTATTTYNDTGCITRSEKKICNYDAKARGVVPMQEILNQSLNTGATFVVDKMGHSVFERYMKAYGFGQKTGLDLPNEVTGDISAINNRYDIDYASASFGQGVAVSPIEMIRALSALANRGELPMPHLVKSVRFESGLSRSIAQPRNTSVSKPESVEIVTNMLVQVVDKALLKGVLKQERYSIAAKTGTAQMADARGGGYSQDRFLHSFFGYFPAYDPKFIVFLYAVEPHGAEFASATLAKPFMELAKFLINYYEIPPDR